MSGLLWIGIGMLGGVGALARFVVDGAIAEWVSTSFPLGTFVVNLSGAFALGILVGASADADAVRLVGTGLLGSYTTFSTWALESQRLGEDGELGVALANFMLSLGFGVGLAWLGIKAGGAL